MAIMHSVEVNLPSDLYDQIREVARRSDRSVEAVLLGGLTLLFGDTPVDWDKLTGTLDSLPDEQLWALVYRRISWPQGLRLRELTAQGQQGSLTEAERAEQESLLDEADRYTLLRSRALLLLNNRGYDIEARLKLGA